MVNVRQCRALFLQESCRALLIYNLDRNVEGGIGARLNSPRVRNMPLPSDVHIKQVGGSLTSYVDQAGLVVGLTL